MKHLRVSVDFLTSQVCSLLGCGVSPLGRHSVGVFSLERLLGQVSHSVECPLGICSVAVMLLWPAPPIRASTAEDKAFQSLVLVIASFLLAPGTLKLYLWTVHIGSTSAPHRL